MDRVLSLACHGKKPTSPQRCESLPQQGSLFVRYNKAFIEERVCCRIFCAVDMGIRCDVERVHQSRSVADFPCILERVRSVRKRGFRIAKHLQGPRPMGQSYDPRVLAAKSHRQGAMLGRIVLCKRLIVACSAFRDVSGEQ